MNSIEKQARKIFDTAGILLNGKRPFDLQVHNHGFYARFLRNGTLGLGESYMDGWWDCEDIPTFMAKFAQAGLSRKFRHNPVFLLNRLKALLFNEGSAPNALYGVRSHYDIGNDLFLAMLDPRMVYTCAYWNETNTLDQAQEDKLELICRKLQLQPGMTVLDIGCGWGSFLKYAAEKYGINGVGISNSVQQLELARSLCAGLPIAFHLQDYRESKGQFDRVLSVGMFEHVSYKNHRAYMKMVAACLKPGGLSLLHTMGRTKSMVRGNDQWITKYIFPNTQVPSVAQIGEAIDGLFVLEDWENLSTDYEKTLLAWCDNFKAHWPISNAYDQRFYRMWTYYLYICAGWYRARALQLWQVVVSQGGIPGGYDWQKQRKILRGAR